MKQKKDRGNREKLKNNNNIEKKFQKMLAFQVNQ